MAQAICVKLEQRWSPHSSALAYRYLAYQRDLVIHEKIYGLTKAHVNLNTDKSRLNTTGNLL